MKTPLDRAREAVYGQRQDSYGHPADNHARTAILWRAHILAKYGIDVPLDAVDVCWMSINIKQSRDMNVTPETPVEDWIDNPTDVAGYANNIFMIRARDEDDGMRERAA